MTPATLWVRFAATVAAVALIVAAIPPEPVIVTARIVGLVVCGAVIWWYHRHADWASTAIGRGTMAIKACIFAVALAANINTLNDHVIDHDLDALAARGLAGAWLLLTIALTFRLVTMRRIQSHGETVSVIEKE